MSFFPSKPPDPPLRELPGNDGQETNLGPEEVSLRWLGSLPPWMKFEPGWVRRCCYYDQNLEVKQGKKHPCATAFGELRLFREHIKRYHSRHNRCETCGFIFFPSREDLEDRKKKHTTKCGQDKNSAQCPCLPPDVEDAWRKLIEQTANCRRSSQTRENIFEMVDGFHIYKQYGDVQWAEYAAEMSILLKARGTQNSTGQNTSGLLANASQSQSHSENETSPPLAVVLHQHPEHPARQVPYTSGVHLPAIQDQRHQRPTVTPRRVSLPPSAGGPSSAALPSWRITGQVELVDLEWVLLNIKLVLRFKDDPRVAGEMFEMDKQAKNVRLLVSQRLQLQGKRQASRSPPLPPGRESCFKKPILSSTQQEAISTTMVPNGDIGRANPNPQGLHSEPFFQPLIRTSPTPVTPQNINTGPAAGVDDVRTVQQADESNGSSSEDPDSAPPAEGLPSLTHGTEVTPTSLEDNNQPLAGPWELGASSGEETMSSDSPAATKEGLKIYKSDEDVKNTFPDADNLPENFPRELDNTDLDDTNFDNFNFDNFNFDNFNSDNFNFDNFNSDNFNSDNFNFSFSPLL
ncbi:hypothetical protein VTJ04DRAFT_598 [Mycothermus thermophilus]|uniref:uncharacterized protein n=1 Tax=Humicola insolens TaxID=85995 RepID=UPI003742D55A